MFGVSFLKKYPPRFFLLFFVVDEDEKEQKKKKMEKNTKKGLIGDVILVTQNKREDTHTKKRPHY